MLDADLASLYEVPIKRLNEQVKRNRERFPDDFMFQLTEGEAGSLRSQIATSETGSRGLHRKYRPYAFTEQGVAMLSSVLRSPRAVQVNVEIMRAFVRLRRMLGANEELARKLDALEAKYDTVQGRFPGDPRVDEPAGAVAAPDRLRHDVGGSSLGPPWPLATRLSGSGSPTRTTASPADTPAATNRRRPLPARCRSWCGGTGPVVGGALLLDKRVVQALGYAAAMLADETLEMKTAS